MKENKSKFNPVLRSGDVLVVAFGAMIGWGWVVSSGQWIQEGGIIGTILGFLIGGIMIYFVGLCYAELTTAMPLCGGEHVFSFKAFGPIGSYICTWAIILSYIGVVCYEAVSFPTILQYIFPNMLKGYMYTINGFDVYASWVAISIVMSVIVVVLNIIGTKKAAIFQKVLTIIIAAVGILLVVASSISGDIENVQSQMFLGEKNGDILMNIFKVAIMTPFFFFGFDVIPQAAEEIRVPLKKIGKLMLLSIVLAVTFYVLVVFAVGYVLNAGEIANSMNTTGLVTADAMAKAFSSSAMAKVLIIGGLCGIITSWNSFLIGGSRAIYSMSESRMIPEVFGKLHGKFKTPITALLLIGGLSILAPFFGRTMLVWIVDAGNFACCLAYCIVALSFVRLRTKEPTMERPYRIKHFKIVGVIAILMSGGMAAMYLIPGTNCSLVWQEWVIVAGWVILGIVLAVRSYIKYKGNFKIDS
ncbi:MAG: APC family permease [Ruminococcaceae bacterium]|nr:APC family permease [Oscillospiraceae bacterium]